MDCPFYEVVWGHAKILCQVGMESTFVGDRPFTGLLLPLIKDILV